MISTNEVVLWKSVKLRFKSLITIIMIAITKTFEKEDFEQSHYRNNAAET